VTGTALVDSLIAAAEVDVGKEPGSAPVRDDLEGVAGSQGQSGFAGSLAAFASK
jgi:hypothetical protein